MYSQRETNVMYQEAMIIGILGTPEINKALQAMIIGILGTPEMEKALQAMINDILGTPEIKKALQAMIIGSHGTSDFDSIDGEHGSIGSPEMEKALQETNEIPEGTFMDPTKELSRQKKHLGGEQSNLNSSRIDSRKVQEQCKQAKEFCKKKLNRVETETRLSTQILSAAIFASRLVDIIDNYDREGNAYVIGLHTYTGTYVRGAENKSGERVPRVGLFAGASTGKARAEFSVFDAEANGPNACAAAEASVYGVTAIARAELGSVSASAGPFNATLGLGVDTGISAGVDGFEIKVLGTGFTIGPRLGLSFLGSEIKCVIM